MGIARKWVIGFGAGAVGAAAVVGTAVATAAPTAAVNHTITLVATQTASHQFSPSTASVAETDRHKGQVIGYDILSETFSKTGGLIRGAFATRGGVLYFRVPVTNSSTLHGTITGGSGRFAGALGTITGKSLNQSGTKTAVTIVYHT